MEYIIIEVPDRNDSVSRVVLDGTQYLIRFTWNDTGGYWSFGVADALNKPILTGVKIVPRFPLNLFYYSVAEMPSGVFGVFTEQERIGRSDFKDEKARFAFIPAAGEGVIHLKNFDRQYRLIAGQAGAEGFQLGDGDTPLHIAFSFQKSDQKAQNSGKLSIWNLNDEHLAELNKDDCVVSLKAGYGSVMPLIFTGIVTHVKTSPDGADRCTEMEVVDNRIEIRDTYISLSYSGTVNTKTLIQDVGNQMGVAVTFSYDAEFYEFPNGYSYVGPAINVLTKACESSKLVWSIQNGVLQVKRPNDVMSKEVYVLSPDSGLIEIPKRVSVANENETKDAQHGWDVEYLMNGAINIDDYVKLESKTVTGFFRVYSLQIEGDNIDGSWTCSARLLEVKES